MAGKRSGGLTAAVAVLVLAATLSVTVVAAPPAAADFSPGARVTVAGRVGVPIPGDFTGDGYLDVLFYNASGTDAFLQGGPGGFQISTDRYVVAASGFIPKTGDFDGNGVTDILWYRPGVGSDAFWYFSSGGTYVRVGTTITGTYQVLVDDFDASGTDDVVLYAAGLAADFLWYSNTNKTRTPVRLTVNGKYSPVAGDFNGNGYADILWYAPGTAGDYQWNFADGTRSQISRTVNGVYKPFVGDFDANAVDDIFWYTPGAGQDFLWSHALGGAHSQQRVSQSGTFTGTAVDHQGDAAQEAFWAGPGRFELWTDPPSEYWWSDTFIDNITAAPEGPRTGYDRDLFVHWILRTTRCDTRDVVLYRESRTSAKVDLNDCSVDAGSWRSYYDNVAVTSASGLHIDHFVPLAEAWDSGAASWSSDRRRAFANDLGIDQTLVAVTGSSNTSKSDSDPAQWKPSYGPSWCRYASEWVTVKDRWNLTADQAELDALDQMLRTCTSDRALLPADPEIGPTYYDSTPTPPPPPPSGCSVEGNAYIPANGGCIDRYDADHNGDINCGELPSTARPVKVKSVSYDPYNLDSDNDGWGCES